MNSFMDYETKLGQLVSMFQLIEHDLKTILRLTDQSLKKEEINKMTLGTVILNIKEKNPELFSSSDLLLLKALTEKRNYYCHRCVLSFIYEEDFENSRQFKNSYKQLLADYDVIQKLQNQTESIRISLISNS